MNALETRLERLERNNRIFVTMFILVLAFLLFSGLTANNSGESIKCTRLEIIDADGKVTAMVGTDEDGSTGLFVFDDAGRPRLISVHDKAQTAWYALDSMGTVRIGLAQFAHGGGGLALHGEQSKGATVMYHKGTGSVTLYDTLGTVTAQFPEK